MAVAARGAHILIVGEHGGAQAEFAWDDLRTSELELLGSNASEGAWPEAVRLATTGHLPLDAFISHRFSADQFCEAVELTRSGRGDVVKIMVEW